MKKLFLLLVGCIFSILPMLGQASDMATLNHENDVKAFYGVNALVEAYNAAVDGDIITLSAGQFKSINIDKNLIIRGAGMDANMKKNRQPTVIINDFSLTNTSESQREITFEGLYFLNKTTYNEFTNTKFIKCRINELKGGETSNGIFTFINCRIANGITMKGVNASAYLKNSVVFSPSSSETGTFNYENCVIVGGPHMIKHSYLSNCIIYSLYSGVSLDSTNTAYNCIGTGSNFNWNNVGSDCKNASNIFKTYKGGSHDQDETFELTDEAKTKYLGNDGTEVGIYGGVYPYDSTPTNPQIIKFEVAPKSTPEGKLSIDITVE